jgi:hypothetical protein
VKCWLGEPPLTPMEAAFTGQQALSEQPLGPQQPAAFAENMVMSHQNVFDQVGIVYEDGPLGAKTKSHKIAVAMG